MPNIVKYNIPRNWRNWNTERIQDFALQSYANGTIVDETVEEVVSDMWDELDEREYVHETYSPGEWDDADELDVPSYAS